MRRIEIRANLPGFISNFVVDPLSPCTSVISLTLSLLHHWTATDVCPIFEELPGLLEFYIDAKHPNDAGIRQIIGDLLVYSSDSLTHVAFDSVPRLEASVVDTLVDSCPQLASVKIFQMKKSLLAEEDDYSITDDSIENMTIQLRNLRGIELFDCVKLSTRSLQHIFENCMFLTSLTLHALPNITNSAAVFVPETLPLLRTLNVVFCEGAGDVLMKKLVTAAVQLERIKIIWTSVTDDTLTNLAEADCRNSLKQISLEMLFDVEGEGFRNVIDSCQSLRNVTFKHSSDLFTVNKIEDKVLDTYLKVFELPRLLCYSFPTQVSGHFRKYGMNVGRGVWRKNGDYTSQE